jgi:hypothetical protein
MFSSRAFVYMSIAALLLPAAFASTATPAVAQKKKNPALCLMGDCGNNNTVQEFDKTAAGLIYAMAKRPELMDLNYLQFFIGQPENLAAMAGRAQRNYHWYDEKRRLAYELQQTEVAGNVTESTFTAHLPNHDMDFGQVGDLFGGDCKHFFDSEAHPTKLYTMAPNTFLTFSSAPHSFRVTRARVLYKGAGLGRATPEEIAQAKQQLKMRTDPIVTNGDPNAAIPILQTRLQHNPHDAETHLQMAHCFARTNRLTEAISEYKYVLATSTDDGLRQQAEDALKQYFVIRSGAPEPQRKTVLKHGGQRIFAHGHDNSKATDPSLGLNPSQGINF